MGYFLGEFLSLLNCHHSGDSIERLDVSAGGELVASVSHDSKIKFWNISYLEDMEYNKTRKPFFNK